MVKQNAILGDFCRKWYEFGQLAFVIRSPEFFFVINNTCTARLKMFAVDSILVLVHSS